MLRPHILVTAGLLVVQGVLGKIYHGIDELPTELEAFDFIVAGGGTAGCVLASRLSEGKRFNVLLIEAGSDNAGVSNLTIPAWSTAGQWRWNYTSVPMTGLNGRTLTIPRGHVLGGSSSINAMIYTRGSADDYDNWGRVTGDRRWSWKSLWPYILRSEHWTPPTGGRDPTGQYDPKAHGYRGKVLTSLSWSGPNDIDRRAIRNTEFREEFPFALDWNSGDFVGLGYRQSTIGNGERSSAATAYLSPSVRERPNLTILLNTYITRVRPTSRVGSKPVITTVEIAPRTGGERKTISALKELILSGGVIGSAQILLNSGIGNATELKALGIPSVLDIPDVGENLMEHVAIPMRWTTVPQNVTTIPDSVAMDMWLENRTGPLTERGGHQFLFTRMPTNSSLFQTYKDPSTGPRTPHFQASVEPAGGQVVGLMTPYSRGSVKLRSSNPFDDPAIDLNLLSHQFDLKALKEAVRIMKRWNSGPGWDGYITGFAGPDPDVLSDEEFESVVRETAITFLHPVGTARMSSKDSKSGVVDGELRLKGAVGLRIVDASVFPYIPSANTQAAVYILAERASDLIRDTW